MMISVDPAQQLAAQYSIRSIPTLALFVGGRELARQAERAGALEMVDRRFYGDTGLSFYRCPRELA